MYTEQEKMKLAGINYELADKSKEAASIVKNKSHAKQHVKNALALYLSAYDFAKDVDDKFADDAYEQASKCAVRLNDCTH